MNNDAPSSDPPPGDPPIADPASEELSEQVVEAFPVLAEIVTVERSKTTAMPAIQAAAVAATGFVAGAATMALLKRHGARRLARQQRDLGALPDLRENRELSRHTAEPGASGARSTYLVNVRLIARSGD
jgi:hypothetical protein